MLVTFSKVKKIIKTSIILTAIGLIFLMYQSHYFDLLQARFGLSHGRYDDMTNGRLEIWHIKLSGFFSDGNFFNQLFGYGEQRGLTLGLGRYLAFHNDFIAFLCYYGIIGLGFFCTVLYYPVWIVNKKRERNILVLLSYLLVVCFSLEPLAFGNIVFFGYYLYIVLLAKNIHSNEKVRN